MPTVMVYQRQVTAVGMQLIAAAVGAGMCVAVSLNIACSNQSSRTPLQACCCMSRQPISNTSSGIRGPTMGDAGQNVSMVNDDDA